MGEIAATQLQQLIVEARIDENRIAFDWPRDKGLQYFEERLQKRQTKLLQLQAQLNKEVGDTDE